MGNKGNITILVCITFSLLFLGAASYWLFSSNEKSAKNSDPELIFNGIKNRISEAINRTQTLDLSMEKNPNSFNCMLEGKADCAGKGGTFLLYEDSSSVALSQLANDGGLNWDGTVCRGFPSEHCPFRVESSWSPICKANTCEGTQNFHMKVAVFYNDGKTASPLVWKTEKLQTPNLKLSQAVACEREGHVWAQTECISPEQATQRNIASKPSVVGPEGMDEQRLREEEAQMSSVAPVSEPVCPDQIFLHEQYWNLERIDGGRAQAYLPSANGCPNAQDLVTFQCSPKIPASFPGEGQWLQLQIVMAPQCDAGGNPIDPNTRE